MVSITGCAWCVPARAFAFSSNKAISLFRTNPTLCEQHLAPSVWLVDDPGVGRFRSTLPLPTVSTANRRPSLFLTLPTSPGILLSVTEVSVMTKPKDLVQGTLDLLILRIVALESMHGWAIARRIRQMSSDVLQVGQSALYPALHKLEQQGWIKAEWKISETNRRAKYYSLTRAGRKALTEEAANWERLSAAISAVVRTV
jgi:PadR family transcriptional regulator PadR